MGCPKGQIVIEQVPKPPLVVASGGQGLAPEEPMVNDQNIGSGGNRPLETLKASIDGKRHPVHLGILTPNLKAVEGLIFSHPSRVVEGAAQEDVEILQGHEGSIDAVFLTFKAGKSILCARSR